MSRECEHDFFEMHGMRGKYTLNLVMHRGKRRDVGILIVSESVGGAAGYWGAVGWRRVWIPRPGVCYFALVLSPVQSARIGVRELANNVC